MAGMNGDQLHRSTLGIYSNLIEEFNPNLQKLVSLGNSYMQAFKALAVTSEAYFNALSKIGEKAFHTMSSQSLGDVLIQICENQRRITLELEGVFRWFSVEVLQEMENNIRRDKDYISDSRKQYEMEVHSYAAALERQLRRVDNQDYSEYVQFLRTSHGEALKEEERRHRFLAEKHCGLMQSIAHLMNKTGGSLHQRVDVWIDEVNASRGAKAGRHTSSDYSMGAKEEDFKKSREEMTLGNIPSRAPSPQGSLYYSRSETAGSEAGGRSMRALAAHQPGGANTTLLPFSRGEMITVLIQKPKNGWLYGRAESSSRPGWFPATYVEAMDDPVETNSYRSSTLRSSSTSSMSNLLDQPRSRSQSLAPPPPPPPPPSSSSEMQPITPTPDRRAKSHSENRGPPSKRTPYMKPNDLSKRSKPQDSKPELFPRGTNPFATVKLRPTQTNDKSAPRLYRR